MASSATVVQQRVQGVASLVDGEPVCKVLSNDTQSHILFWQKVKKKGLVNGVL